MLFCTWSSAEFGHERAASCTINGRYMTDEVTAIAKAVEEIAKATGKSIDAIKIFGGFIAEYTRAPFKAGFGIVADKLMYMRWERQQRLLIRAKHFLEQAGLDGPTRAVPMNFAIALIEAASLEENDDLQDLWATMLVNAANAESPTDRRRAYISILEQLTSLDALILSKIYSLPTGDSAGRAAITVGLPASVRLSTDTDDFNSLQQPSAEVMLSLANLVRIGCIDAEENWGGEKDYRHAYRNILGSAFVESVTLQKP